MDQQEIAKEWCKILSRRKGDKKMFKCFICVEWIEDKYLGFKRRYNNTEEMSACKACIYDVGVNEVHKEMQRNIQQLRKEHKN